MQTFLGVALIYAAIGGIIRFSLDYIDPEESLTEYVEDRVSIDGYLTFFNVFCVVIWPLIIGLFIYCQIRIRSK